MLSRHVPFVVLALVLGATSPAHAQTSARFHLTEHVLNASGHPAQGAVLSSTSFRIRLDSLGDSLVGTTLASASFRIDGGFLAAYPPPGEVHGDVFTSKTLLQWQPERSAGTYEVYRGAAAGLPGGFGTCLAYGLTVPAYVESDAPGSGGAYFYLATVRNRLGQEGTKGFQTSGAERSNSAPCP